ncbi:MAG: DNA primase [Candidatus Eremiobacteraeota bacterium]|nr:DNA primase [Candidatus Eremiobacteraeota bacterium]
MRFDQGTIREIHARIDIAAFIGAYVQLRKRGNDLVGLCPFHSERTPSFHVHPDKGFFKCFGCDKGGDVIAFVQNLENVPFPEAVRMLAARAGVELEAESPGAARQRGEREVIYEANQIAVAFFAAALRDERGAKARDYCERRGISSVSIERFHLGYAPDSWDGLVTELQRSGIDLELAAKAGLLKPGQRGFYDFYRDRLMIPTYSTTGEAIAFGGRALGEVEPKYLNTATTPVYTKGRHVYALNLARRAAQFNRTLIVVEGYLDCIALQQAGFENAVASLGTAFTEEQAGELHKYADNIFICFDADAAGSNAAGKAVDIAAKVIENAGSSLRIVQLPSGQDPDSFVRENGAQAFGELLESAKPSIEFKLDPQIDRLRSGFDSPAVIARQAEQLIREMTPRAEWDKWRVYIAGRLKVNVNDLRNSRFFANSANFAPRIAGTSVSAGRHLPLGIDSLSFERDVLEIMLEEPALLREYRERILPERFRNEVYRSIYGRMAAQAEGLNGGADVLGLFAEDSDAAELLASLGRRERSSTTRYADAQARRAHLERVVESLQLEDQKERYQELSNLIDELGTSGQPIESALRAEYDGLVALLKNKKPA